MWNEDETKQGTKCDELSEQELRKELYDMVIQFKKKIILSGGNTGIHGRDRIAH